jgi:hypothetical protein
MAADDKEQEPFAVKDKRRFGEDELQETAADENGSTAEEKSEPEAPPSESAPTQGGDEAIPSSEEKHEPLPDIDFSTFVLSLCSNALLHLGLMENPLTKKVERSLPMAKQTIDIVSMLKEKAKGNLTNEEENLIENLLTDLRLKYVNEVNKG